MTRHAEIELPFNYDPPSFYCPACGAPLVGPDQGEPCEHMILTDIPGLVEEVDVAPRYAALVEEIEAMVYEGEVDDLVPEFLRRADRPSMLVVSIDFGGMACGPVHYCLTAVVDFAPDAE